MLMNKELSKFIQKDFMEAIYDGNAARVKALLDIGINPNKFKETDPVIKGDWTPLLHAACQMDFKIVEALITAGADVNISLIDGNLSQSIYTVLRTNKGASKAMTKAMITFIRECAKEKGKKLKAVTRPHGLKIAA